KPGTGSATRPTDLLFCEINRSYMHHDPEFCVTKPLGVLLGGLKIIPSLIDAGNLSVCGRTEGEQTEDVSKLSREVGRRKFHALMFVILEDGRPHRLAKDFLAAVLDRGLRRKTAGWR